MGKCALHFVQGMMMFFDLLVKHTCPFAVIVRKTEADNRPVSDFPEATYT